MTKMMDSTTSSPGATQAQNVLSQFRMHFLLSCHTNSFGLGDQSGPVLPVCSCISHKSCPWEWRRTKQHPQSPSKNRPDTEWLQRPERVNNGVVLMLPLLSSWGLSLQPQLPAQTHPWRLQWEDHLSRQMAQRAWCLFY